MEFRLWLPRKELEPLQKEVDAMKIEELQRRYSELLELAKDRDMKWEFEEEWNTFLRMDTINEKKVWASPWKVVDLYPNGRIDFCGWSACIEYMSYRNHFLHGNYQGCQPCCPCNNVMNPVISVHDKGFFRDEV